MHRALLNGKRRLLRIRLAVHKCTLRPILHFGAEVVCECYRYKPAFHMLHLPSSSSGELR